MKAIITFAKVALFGLFVALCLSACAYAESEPPVADGIEFENVTPMFSVGYPTSAEAEQEILNAKNLEVLLGKEHKTRDGKSENYKLVSVFQKQKEYVLVLNDKNVLFVAVGPDSELEDFVSAVDTNIDAGVYEDPLYRDRITERK